MTGSRGFVAAATLGMVLLAASPTRAAAQQGVIGGTVYRDTADHVLAAVEISLPALNRKTLSNYAGDFRFTGVPAGKYAVVFRHLGFAPLVDTVVVADNAPVDREYVLAEQAVTLEGVSTIAAERRYINSSLNEFLDRKKSGMGGYFIDENLIRKNDNRKLNDILTSNIPGLRTFRPIQQRPTFEYLSSGRGTCAGAAFSCGGERDCPVALYVDGHLVFNAGIEKDPNNWPDIGSFKATDYAGVEYYPGGATVPAQFNATSNTCGVLLLWSREK